MFSHRIRGIQSTGQKNSMESLSYMNCNFLQIHIIYLLKKYLKLNAEEHNRSPILPIAKLYQWAYEFKII
jgi:hypothetical protein